MLRYEKAYNLVLPDAVKTISRLLVNSDIVNEFDNVYDCSESVIYISRTGYILYSFSKRDNVLIRCSVYDILT